MLQAEQRGAVERHEVNTMVRFVGMFDNGVLSTRLITILIGHLMHVLLLHMLMVTVLLSARFLSDDDFRK